MTKKEQLIYSENDVKEIINNYVLNRVWITVVLIATIPVCAFGGWIINSGNEYLRIQKQLTEAQLELIEKLNTTGINPSEINRLRQELTQEN